MKKIREVLNLNNRGGWKNPNAIQSIAKANSPFVGGKLIEITFFNGVKVHADFSNSESRDHCYDEMVVELNEMAYGVNNEGNS